ncbi:Asp-tRNA(Asn)/Glu-tRNA(Gln) amidotransferase subunit GatC [Paludibaculum fermentans]|uniref:Asp-tRNA(Asn)/Glu-tRNA(Gln) amidotransferase subunit GatC n=1 Tax=Paludibaculum fermentans TaxID=1473598 RepID=UPI003EB77048
MKITEQEVKYVADLANLQLSAEETARMAHDLDGILSHIDKLNELDVSGVEPMSQVLYDSGETDTLREDLIEPSLDNQTALANAPLSGAGQFKVPKIIER